MNSKVKPMYQPWSEEDFMADPFVQKMDCKSRWMYRTLLQSCFSCSTRPYLPSEDSKLWVLAGCENLKIWLKFKHKVLSMFEVIEKNGVKFYARKRVVKDWQRVENIIVTNKRNAKIRWSKSDDATAMRPHTDRNATAIQVKLREVKRSEVKRSEVKESEDMRKENFRVPCLKMGLKADPDNSGSWRELKDMCEAFGDDLVLERFMEWLPNQEGSRYPISMFVKELPSLVQAPGLTKKDLELDNLALELYSIGKISFSGKQAAALAGLRSEFSDKEIVAAWRKFIDDESTSFPTNWPGKFVSGAGRTILLFIRKELERQEQTRREVEEIIKQGQAESDRRTTQREAEAAEIAREMEDLRNGRI